MSAERPKLEEGEDIPRYKWRFGSLATPSVPYLEDPAEEERARLLRQIEKQNALNTRAGIKREGIIISFARNAVRRVTRR